MKTAIFVEGQTELIWVREMLLKIFDYQNISIACYNLFAVENLHATEYPFPNENAAYHFQIVNVGNDNAVLDRLLKREKRLWQAGFDRIIGLRDMYSSAYREIAGKSAIVAEINQQFKNGHQEQIDNRATKPEQIFFQFAVMESESWLLGVPTVFEKLDNGLTVDIILERLDIDLENIDPETTFFHPANQVEIILGLVGKRYSKKKGEINAIVSHLEKGDYLALDAAEKCSSFSQFYAVIPKEETIV